MMKTEAAKCAAEIRKYMKAKGVKASVTSKTYSMGCSVNVKIKEIIDPKVLNEINDDLAIYQYGKFDGMQDLYENTNVMDEIPQTKYLFIEYDYKVADVFTEALVEVLKDKINLVDPNPYRYEQMARRTLYGREQFMTFGEACAAVIEYYNKNEAA
jgi:hypothetical protein